MTRISFALNEEYELVFIADVICREINIFIKNEDERILALVTIMFDSKEQMHEKLRELAWYEYSRVPRIKDFGNYAELIAGSRCLTFEMGDLTDIEIPCDLEKLQAELEKLQAELQKLYPKKQENKMPELQVEDAVEIFGSRGIVIDSIEKSVRVAYRNGICEWEDKTEIRKIYRNGELIWEIR